ncbi:zinc finger protein 37-like [Ptychodera flava]|uniref:zinc finger protein 37-like n=1 Tax=Ptychodera flava TaxID=63121 RepID=UPI003969FEB0
MELQSRPGLHQLSRYATMNDLLFKQFGFQVLGNNTHEENTDTYPILVQCVLRESDVEIWGGFCVRAYIVKLDFQKSPGQPEMCLAIMLKNKYTPDVKRLEAPFKLQAFHLQWIQNVLGEDVDGVRVTNSKEIPFIAMYDVVEMSETERATTNLKSWKETEQTQDTLMAGNYDKVDNVVEEMDTKGTVNQSDVKEESHDPSPSGNGQVCQEMPINTVDKNNQSQLEDYIDEQNQEGVKDLQGVTKKPSNCDISQDLANIPNTETDSVRSDAQLSTRESNQEMVQSDTNSNAAASSNLETPAEMTEFASGDCEGASDSDSSFQPDTGSDSDDEYVPRYKTKRQRAATRSTGSKQKKLKCEDCGKFFKLKRTYNLHMESHKKNKTEDKSELGKRAHKRGTKKRRFQCRFCEIDFELFKELQQHVRSGHPGQKPYACDMCGSSQRDMGSLNRHKKEVHQPARYQCDECDQVFKARGNLNFHKTWKHQCVWKFQCDICGKWDYSRDGHKKHMLSHTNEKLFQCEVCGKGFKEKATLNRHLKIHSGKKPHLCEVCGKGFGRKEHLKEHEVVHTKLNTFLCDYCGKSFSNKTNLYVHRRQHTGIHPVVCKICGQGFHRKRELAKHMEKIHQNSATDRIQQQNFAYV